MKHDNQPLVSAIIIFFNEERYLTEAIESVLGQTYDNWELLLVDDGSTDGSTAIAKSYADRHNNVRYLEHRNHQSSRQHDSSVHDSPASTRRPCD